MQEEYENENYEISELVEDFIPETVATANEDIIPDTESEFLPDEVEVIGVRFKRTGKVYYFDPCGKTYAAGKHVLVKTARGVEYATVAMTNTTVSGEKIVPPLRHVIREAVKSDDERYAANIESEREAYKIFNDKIAEHKLEMKLVDVEYTFDNNRLTFYFTADGRVDFRELVKDLASVFKTRIELRQIGIRDETKIIGGLGVCGRPFCCASFLPEFSQVSIKMAKEQNLSLNSAKISGVCGKLMCCLRFEHETYEEESRRTPKLDSVVMTPDGEGVVTEVNPLAGTVKVRLNSEADKPPKLYKRNEIIRNASGEKTLPEPDEAEEDIPYADQAEQDEVQAPAAQRDDHNRRQRNRRRQRRHPQKQNGDNQ